MAILFDFDPADITGYTTGALLPETVGDVNFSGEVRYIESGPGGQPALFMGAYSNVMTYASRGTVVFSMHWVVERTGDKLSGHSGGWDLSGDSQAMISIGGGLFAYLMDYQPAQVMIEHYAEDVFDGLKVYSLSVGQDGVARLYVDGALVGSTSPLSLDPVYSNMLTIYDAYHTGSDAAALSRFIAYDHAFDPADVQSLVDLYNPAVHALSWDPVTGATGYQVRSLYADGHIETSKVEGFTGTQILGERPVAVQVTAYNEHGHSTPVEVD